MNSYDTYFLNTIKHLRLNEEIILYANLPILSTDEENLLIDFLANEYRKESTNYPYSSPVYNAQAALWGASIIYYASQMMLYRENKGEEIAAFLPPYAYQQDASAILSADLCLRFLPQVLENLKNIDPDDIIIPLLKNHLHQWHYSAIGLDLDNETLNFNGILGNECLKQLYINRIIENKAKVLAQLPFLKNHVKASMGNFSSYFWKEFN